MDSDLDARLAEAVEDARVLAWYTKAPKRTYLLNRYGDLRAMQAKRQENARWGHQLARRNHVSRCLRCIRQQALDDEAEALLAGGGG